MTLLRVDHILTWRIKLCDGGYLVHELVDGFGVRWGWVIRAGTFGWDAHAGDFGQAATIGQSSPPVVFSVESFGDDVVAAKSWVEEQIAVAWKKHGDHERLS